MQDLKPRSISDLASLESLAKYSNNSERTKLEYGYRIDGSEGYKKSVW